MNLLDKYIIDIEIEEKLNQINRKVKCEIEREVDSLWSVGGYPEYKTFNNGKYQDD